MTPAPADIAGIAAQIVGYRRDGRKLAAGSWQLGSEDDANAIQDLVAKYIAEPVAGWKIGAVDAAGQQRLGLSRPFIGRAFRSRVWQSPASVRGLRMPDCIPESEFAFRLARDLPVRPQSYAPDEVTDAIATCHLAFELVDFSFADRSGMKGRDFVADNGGCAGLVVGPEVIAWRRMTLSDIPIELRIDGDVIAHGFAKPREVLLERVAWLAEHLRGRGIGMTAGQVVATGNWTGMTPMRSGQRAVAQFGDLGRVVCELGMNA